MKTLLALLVLSLPIGVSAQSLDAVSQDPAEIDSEYPPALAETSFESEGARLNAIVYVANGPGPHPTVMLLHGFPGNEKNLDIAQVLRRAGMNVVFFHYRGSWGSGGEYSPTHAAMDVQNVLDTVQSVEWAGEHRTDPSRIAILGHSMGAFYATMVGSGRDEIECVATLDAWNAGAFGASISESPEGQARLTGALQEAFGDGAPLEGSAAQFTEEVVGNAHEFDFVNMVPQLVNKKLLVIAATNGGLAADNQAYAKSLQEAGAVSFEYHLLEDDHSFSAHRVKLSELVLDWFNNTCWSE
jgi:pimeloyl-ACP methyl ester carboxylesterase